MNSQSRPPTGLPELLDQAIEALRATPVSNGPSEDLIHAAGKSVAAQLELQTRKTALLPRQRPRAAWYFGYGALATAALVLVGILLSGIGEGTAAALDKALEGVRRAESVRFRVSDSVPTPSRPAEDGERSIPDWLRQTITTAHTKPENAVTVSRNRFRIDGILGPGSTWIIDWDQKRALIMDSNQRVFEQIDMHRIAVSPMDFGSMNICDELLALRKQTATFVGTEVVNGMKADKYAVHGGKAFHTQGDWVIWIGRGTGLPVQVTVAFDVQGVVVTRLYDTFDWNPVLDPATFSLAPLEGYRPQLILHPLHVVPADDPQ